MQTLTMMERRLIEIPKDITCTIQAGNKITIKGKLGTVERSFPLTSAKLELVTQDNTGKEGTFLAIWDYFPKRRQKAMVGTIEGHVKNMITGVQKGFTYKLKIVYSHFPITVTAAKGGVITNGHYGTKEKRFIPLIDGVKATVKGEDVLLEGIDIEKVSQSAARLQESTKLRGRLAKDPRIFQDGIYIYESGPTAK